MTRAASRTKRRRFEIAPPDFRAMWPHAPRASWSCSCHVPVEGRTERAGGDVGEPAPHPRQQQSWSGERLGADLGGSPGIKAVGQGYALGAGLFLEADQPRVARVGTAQVKAAGDSRMPLDGAPDE